MSANLCRLTVLLAFTTAAAAHAQLPSDNGVWKSRCALLASSVSATGAASSPALTGGTRGVPGQKFYVLAVNRAQAGEHNVACTLYYMASIADANGNGGKADAKMAKNYAILASAEVRLAAKQHLTMAQHLKRGEMKVESVGGLSLNADETTAVLNAATTMPVTLPPAGQVKH